MPHSDTIEHLNHLITINKDAENGFRSAAENVRNSELETLFANYAKQHAKFLRELEDEIRHLDGSVSDAGSLSGAVHRGWMDLKAAVSGHSAKSMLTSCESGEQSAESAYLDAAEAHPTGQTHVLITKHLEQIKAIRTRLSRLVGETRDGIEFQKNEPD